MNDAKSKILSLTVMVADDLMRLSEACDELARENEQLRGEVAKLESQLAELRKPRINGRFDSVVFNSDGTYRVEVRT